MVSSGRLKDWCFKVLVTANSLTMANIFPSVKSGGIGDITCLQPFLHVLQKRLKSTHIFLHNALLGAILCFYTIILKSIYFSTSPRLVNAESGFVKDTLPWQDVLIHFKWTHCLTDFINTLCIRLNGLSVINFVTVYCNQRSVLREHPALLVSFMQVFNGATFYDFKNIYR